MNTLTDDIIDGVADKGAWLKDAFIQSFSDLPIVTEIRQRGLMLGIQLDRPCGELVNRARDAGLLINVTAGSVVRLLPLVISQAEMQHLVDTLSTLIHRFADEQEVA